MPAMTRTTQSILLKRTALAEGVHAMPTSPCCMATTAARSRPPRCSPCSTGWASSRRTRARAFPMTTPSSNRSSRPPSTARNSRCAALPIWKTRAPGAMTSCAGTTSIIATAASATSRPRSATRGKIGDPGGTSSDVSPGPRRQPRALVREHARLVTIGLSHAQSGARCSHRDYVQLKHKTLGCMNQATTILTCSGF
jgi:hypothetical protein